MSNQTFLKRTTGPAEILNATFSKYHYPRASVAANNRIIDNRNAEQRTPRRRPPPMLLPPVFHPRNSNQNQSKFLPQKIGYIQSKIEEKLADIEIESRKEIDKLFQKFSSKIRAAAANQNLQKQNDPKSKE
uniref:Uncharacterized protein n=1 Tax=Panagrolaimus davidi TaxID=227884 RepID=A0A914QQ61_9BILA